MKGTKHPIYKIPDNTYRCLWLNLSESRFNCTKCHMVIGHLCKMEDGHGVEADPADGDGHHEDALHQEGGWEEIDHITPRFQLCESCESFESVAKMWFWSWCRNITVQPLPMFNWESKNCTKKVYVGGYAASLGKLNRALVLHKTIVLKAEFFLAHSFAC